jgi:hypothetical protein
MYGDVMFQNPDNNIVYLGRNGTGKCKGLSVCVSSQHRITLTPFNSKGQLASGCCIDIPKEDVPAVCAAMQEDLVTEALGRLPAEMWPVFIGASKPLEDIAKKLLATPAREKEGA